MVELVERLEDYALDRLEVISVNGVLELHGWFGGTECEIVAKPSLDAAGVVCCLPFDDAVGFDWPMQVRIRVDGVDMVLDNATADPRAVAAFRVFSAACAAGRAVAAMPLE